MPPKRTTSAARGPPTPACARPSRTSPTRSPTATRTFSDNQAAFRQTLGGERTWVDPNDGHRVSLPYLGENVPYTDPNGYVYQRDASGRYFVRDLNGYVYEMTPEP